MKKIGIHIISIFLSTLSWGQSDSLYDISPYTIHDRFNFHINTFVVIPLNELKNAIQNNFGNVGVGFSAGLLANPFGKKKPSPIFVGGEFSYLTYGVDKIRESAINPPIKTTFNVYYVNIAGRMLLTQDKAFVPFIDGLLGARILNTRTKIDKDFLATVLNDDQPEVISTTNDTGINYGIGIGFYNRKTKTSDAENHISFTCRILYSWGADAHYIIRDSVTIDPNGIVGYETGQTKTDMVSIQLGVMLF